MRRAELKPELPASLFPQVSQNPLECQRQSKHIYDRRHLGTTTGPSHAPTSNVSNANRALEDDEFMDIEVDDRALMEAGKCPDLCSWNLGTNLQCSRRH